MGRFSWVIRVGPKGNHHKHPNETDAEGDLTEEEKAM